MDKLSVMVVQMTVGLVGQLRSIFKEGIVLLNFHHCGWQTLTFGCLDNALLEACVIVEKATVAFSKSMVGTWILIKGR